MSKSSLLNGKIRVGLGQTKSGKVLEASNYYGLYSKSQTYSQQIEVLKNSLHDHLNSGKRVFFNNGRNYREVNASWLQEHITTLFNEWYEKEDCKAS